MSRARTRWSHPSSTGPTPPTSRTRRPSRWAPRSPPAVRTRSTSAASGLPAGSPAVVMSLGAAPMPLGTAGADGSLNEVIEVATPATGEDWWFAVICPPGTTGLWHRRGLQRGHRSDLAPLRVRRLHRRHLTRLIRRHQRRRRQPAPAGSRPPGTTPPRCGPQPSWPRRWPSRSCAAAPPDQHCGADGVVGAAAPGDRAAVRTPTLAACGCGWIGWRCGPASLRPSRSSGCRPPRASRGRWPTPRTARSPSTQSPWWPVSKTWSSRCRCCARATSPGARRRSPRSGSTRTRAAPRAPGRCRSACTTPTGLRPSPTSCAASWSPPCATPRVESSWPASSVGGSTTAPFGSARPATGPTPSRCGSRPSSAGPWWGAPSVASSTTSWVGEDEHDPSPLLERWADALGLAAAARTTAPYQVGWCSWYHYFAGVTETDLRSNLARAADWPFDVFQLDDGYQADIGDWRRRTPTSPRRSTAWPPRSRPRAACPGSGSPRSRSPLAPSWPRAHPDWAATHLGSGTPLVCMLNDHWGGAVHALDTSNPAVLDHLEETARSLVEAGYPYLKLDFTYAPSLQGGYADPTRTPAQRVRAGFDAVRRGAGPDTFLLGCGAPLGRVGRRRRRHADRPGRGAVVARAGRGMASTRPRGRRAGDRERVAQHAQPLVPAPPPVAQRPGLPHAADRAHPPVVRAGARPGLWPSRCRAAWPSSPTTSLSSTAMPDRCSTTSWPSDGSPTPRPRRGATPRCPDLLDADPPARLATADNELVGQPDAGTAYLQGLLA